MSAGPLPQRVNIRKAVTLNARYSGALGAAQLPQFAEFLGASVEPLALTVEFGRDDEERQYARVRMRANVTLECQRCLGPLQRVLESDSRLAIVRTDEEARALPAEYEPLIALEEIDLWNVAAEELALALPVVAYHPDSECKAPTGSGSVIEKDQKTEGTAAPADSPFRVLSSLLASDVTEEK